MDNMKKSTIYDVTAETGLSIATISRVINQNGSYSKKTEEKVRQAIEKLNYTPSASARSLASQSSHIIGLVMNDSYTQNSTEYAYSLQFLNGVASQTARTGYHILLYNGPAEVILPALNSNPHNCEGYIFGVNTSFLGDSISEYIKKGFPVTYTGFQLPSSYDGMCGQL